MSAPAVSAVASPLRRPWLVFALTTVALWGVWGALSPLSSQRGFPDTLVYCVWALTMIPPALFILWRGGWALDRSPRAIAFGMAIGLLGAGGQMLLFHALTIGPAYFVFPIISLSPVVTIALSFMLLRERTGWMGALGIALALLALPMLDLSLGRGASGLGWFVESLLIMAAWGVQAYFMRLANNTVRAESIFFYMALCALLLAPVALAYLFWRYVEGAGALGQSDLRTHALLLSAGVITAGPLLLFAYGARRIRFTTLGLLQYIAPTVQFAIGVWVYHEPVTPERAAAFALIWCGLAVYTADNVWNQRRVTAPA